MAAERDGPARGGEKSVRLGILGLGLAGGIMVPIAGRHARIELTAAADLSPSLRERFAQDHPGVAVFSDAASLMQSDLIDAVYIATPHQFHAEHVLLAVRHGKHAVVEKPMALRLDECDRMTEAADAAGLALIVGHTHGFDPAIARLREWTQSGEFGRLAMVVMWNYTDFLYRPRRPEELDTALGGGIVYNQLPHQIDVARMIAAEPIESVRASLWQLDATRPTEGCCSAALHFRSGAVANLTYSGYDHFDSDELHGWVSSSGFPKAPRHGAARRALAQAGGGDAELQLRQTQYGYGSGRSSGMPSYPPHFGQLIATYERADVRSTPRGLAVYGDDGVREIAFDPSMSGRTCVLDELCAAVLDGQAPVHDGAFARSTLHTCLALLRSCAERRELSLSNFHPHSD